MELDAAEGYYAAGNCKRQKKDFAGADEEFTKSLESRPKSAELIYDIGDYAMKRAQPERLFSVAEAGERASPNDPRGKFYRGVRSEEHTSELQSHSDLVCRLLLE